VPLRDALREFTRTALADLDEQALPVRRRVRVTVRPGGVGSVSDDFAPDWELILGSVVHQQYGSAAFDAFVGAAREDELVAEALPGMRDHGAEVEALMIEMHLLRPFFRHYFKRFGVAFSDDHFDSAYAAFQGYLASSELRVEWVAPLEGVTGKFDECRLNEVVRIARLSREEVENLAGAAERGEFGLLDPVETAKYVGLTHAVRVAQSVPRGALLGPQFRIDEVNDVVSLLRLAGAAVNALPAFPKAEANDGLELDYHDLPWPFRAPEWLRVDTPHAFTDEDVQRFPGEFTALQRATKDKRYALALRRFNAALLRADPGDQVVDYAVGLEALFSPASNQELRFRISARVAVFLEAPGSQRLQIFTDVKKLYDARSAVAHGSTDSESKAVESAPRAHDFMSDGVMT
jgi:hypothetical protein